jgi:hypothetical protein
MPPAADLTGVWAADDGATYYIRQLSDRSVTWAGLNNLGFHRGLDFTNVFRGRVSSVGTVLSGSWADVPRGESNNSGTLSLDIVPSLYGPPIGPNELRQKADGTSGGFGGKVWTRGLLPLGPFPLGPQNIEDIESRVQRYDVPLGENNPPCRDFTVMWARSQRVDWPNLPPERTYCSFWYPTSLEMVHTSGQRVGLTGISMMDLLMLTFSRCSIVISSFTAKPQCTAERTIKTNVRIHRSSSCLRGRRMPVIAFSPTAARSTAVCRSDRY